MNIFKLIVLLMVRIYQKCISPYLPQSCRFHPTCSVYAYDAIDRYGLLKGGLLATKRILRCHPYSDGGFDPVP